MPLLAANRRRACQGLWSLALAGAICGLSLRLPAATVATVATVATADDTPLAPADLARVNLLGQYTSISPSGRFVALMTCGPSARHREYDDGLWLSSGFSSRFLGCQLQVIERASGALVFAPAAISVPGSWAHRTDLLSFAWEQNGRASLYTWSAATRRARRVAALRLRIQDVGIEGLPLWLPDDRRIVVKSAVTESDRGQLEQLWFGAPSARQPAPRAQLAQRAQAAQRERVLTSRAFENAGDRERASARDADETEATAHGELFAGAVYAVDTRTGEATRWLGGVNAIHASISPDGRLLALQDFVGRSASAAGYWVFDVILLDVQTGKRTGQHRIVTKGSGWGHRFSSWSPSGAYLAVGECTILPRAGGVITLEAPDGVRECGQAWATDRDVLYNLHEDANASRWTLDAYTLPATRRQALASGAGRSAALLMNSRRTRVFTGVDGTLGVTAVDPEAGLSRVFRVQPESGEGHELRQAEEYWGGRYPNYVARDFTPDRRQIVSEFETRGRPRELVTLDWASGDVTPLTTLNPRFRTRPAPPGRLYSWRTNGDTGALLRGWLYLAPGASPVRRSPVVVWVYGGKQLALDHNRFGVDAYFNVNLFLDHGLSVFVTDSGPSDGNPRTSIAASIAPGLDAISRHEAIDPDRIAVAGFSFGAYTALSLATMNPRIRATVAICGVYDPWSLYWSLTRAGTTPYLRFLNLDQAFKLGPAPDSPARYLDNSILTHAARIRGSVLLLHGAHDPLPESQPAAVFAALRELRKNVTFVVYEKGRHGFTHSADHAPSLAKIVTWLEQELQVPAATRRMPSTPNQPQAHPPRD